jgi:hypothetical protein
VAGYSVVLGGGCPEGGGGVGPTKAKSKASEGSLSTTSINRCANIRGKLELALQNRGNFDE